MRQDITAQCIYTRLFPICKRPHRDSSSLCYDSINACTSPNIHSHAQRYVPTVFENYVTDCRVDSRDVQLALWDTAGQEDYERLRPLAYSKAHVILIGFSVESPDSLENVKAKWADEARERCPHCPIILVGLKKDLREDPEAQETMRKKSMRFVTTKQGMEMKDNIGAKRYMECSSLTGDGVDDVFEAATRAALTTFEKKEGGGCCIVL